jgi:hypothetical protein
MGDGKTGFDKDMGDGHEPQEEIGPEPGASAEQTELDPGDFGDGIDRSHARFSDELDDAIQPRPEVWVINPNDGLPSAVDDVGTAAAPPFTYENVVCIEDDREVKVFLGDDPRHWPSSEATTDKHGLMYVSDDGKKIRVVPVRRQCEHYQRMVTRAEDNPDVQIIYRHCTARRSVGGAFMSLRDTSVLACTMRSPRDLPSEKKYLDDPEKERLRSKRHLEMAPFPLAGAERK